jgi:hypothetical protein
MKLGFGGVFADAAGLWRANRDLLVRVVGVFFFLPALALQLFVTPVVIVQDMAPEALSAALQNWLLQNWYWVLGNLLVVTFGTAVLFVLLLDTARPALDRALGRGLALLPVLALASLAAGVIVLTGMFALFLPGFYFAGRTMLTGPTVIAEPNANPLAAVAGSIRRTHGHGWMLFLIMSTVSVVIFLTEAIVGDVQLALATVPGAHLVLDVAIAAVSAAGALAQLLLQAAAYRLLSARQGI